MQGASSLSLEAQEERITKDGGVLYPFFRIVLSPMIDCGSRDELQLSFGDRQCFASSASAVVTVTRSIIHK